MAKRAKDPKDPLKLVIVRDMWLTGFDAPCMHTMYVDKPMKGHGLMQAIARVNRVFRDKPAGLVVDYIGIAQNLKSALGQYSSGDRDQTGIDEAEAIRVLLEKYEIVRAMFRPDSKGGFDYRPALHPAATSQARLATMAGAIDWVLTLQQADAPRKRPTRPRSAPTAAMPTRRWRCPRRSRWQRQATRPALSARRLVSFRQFGQR
jgi:type I restriction enzyme R subunit